MLLDIAKFLLASLSGLLLIASIPHDIAFIPFIPTLVWIAFVPLFFAAHLSKSTREAFQLGYFSGFIAYSGLLYWIISFGPVPVIGVSLWYSIFPGLLAAFSKLAIERQTPMAWWWSFPAAATALSLVQGFGAWGFPWILPANALAEYPVFMQSADLGGIFLVGFILYLVNAAVYFAFIHPVEARIKVRILAVAAFLFALNLTYGYYSGQRVFSGEPLSVGVVQGGIESDVEWTGDYNNLARATYIAATNRNVRGNPVDLVIWPESAIGEIVNPEAAFGIHPRIRSMVTQRGMILLLGALTSKNGKFYNSAIAVDRAGRIASIRDKMALVDNAHVRDMILAAVKVGLNNGLRAVRKADTQSVGNSFFK